MRRTATKLEVRAVRCPRCGALPGAKCVGRRGERESSHIGRVTWHATPPEQRNRQAWISAALGR